MNASEDKTPEQRRGIKKTVAILAVVTVTLFLWSIFLVLQQTHV